MQLRLSLFGPLRAILDGEDLRIASRRGQGMLAMLALSPGKAIGRERLAATLWPDRGEDQARASLRQELSRLRRVLGPAAGIDCGDAAFVRIDGTAVPQDFGNESDGDFLEGLDLRSEPFDDWRRQAAARLSGGAKAGGVLSRVHQLQAGFDEAYVRETYPYARLDHVELIIDGLRRAGWTD